MEQVTEVLEPDELEALLAQIETGCPSGARNYAMLQLMAQTGIRCGEALNVTAGMICREEWGTNGDRRMVRVLKLPAKATKGGKPRAPIGLSPATWMALQAWMTMRAALGISGHKPLFCTISEGTRQTTFGGDGKLEPGRALNPRYVREFVAKLAKKAGIEKRVHPHMLRHTALTALYDDKRDLRMVQMVAGHSTSRMTERYTHVHPMEIMLAMDAVE